MNYKTLIDFELWGNKGEDYLIALAVAVLSIAILKIFQVVVLRKLRKAAEHTKTDLDDVLVAIVSKVKPPFYLFVSIYIALNFLHLNDLARKIVTGLFILAVVYEVISAILAFINYAAMKFSQGEDGKVNSSVVNSISLIAKIALWSFAVLLVLSNWGVNITSLVAGLGIGGLAIALAMQKILADIFSSFSIFIDKPFEEGDFIIAGADMGVVQKIGIKTTRIKTLQGEELVVSNQELTGERIRNFKKMEKRRVVFGFGVLYETSAEKLNKIPEIVADIIKKEELADLDRVHFKDFGDSSLNYEVVYYVSSSEYNQYMDIQQSVNLSLKERFEKEGIEFAYPTQTLYINKSVN